MIDSSLNAPLQLPRRSASARTTFDNRDLEKDYATVEALMAHEGLAAMIR